MILSLVCMALSLRCEPFDPSFIGFSQRCRGERLAAKPLAPELAAIGVFWPNFADSTRCRPIFARQFIDEQGPPRARRAKLLVVPTKAILRASNMQIIRGHHVPTLQRSLEGWQAASLLERCREHAGYGRARGAAARAVLGRDQRYARVGLAAIDRGFGGARGATADADAVSRRPLRRAAGGRTDRPRQAVGVAAPPAAAVGRVLAGADAVAGAAA